MPEDKKTTINRTMVPIDEQQTPPGTSKFLKFQDKNGDGLPDVCDDVTPPAKVCKECIPNPYAITRNWRDRSQEDPVLNEKNCKYQITFVTPLTTTGYTEGMTKEESDQALKDIFDRYASDAIQILLEEFQKDDSQETIDKISKVVEYADFHLDARQFSRLKLLYSIDFIDVFDLPDLKIDDEDFEEPERSDIKVRYTAGDMNVLSTRVRKGLDLYNRYLKVFRATEGGNLKFKADDRLFNLGNYGDDGLFGTSVLADTFDQIDSWLDSRGYTMSTSFWDFFSADETITELEMVFDGNYDIKKLSVYTEGCQGRPAAVYKKNRLRSLRRRSGWKDKTAVAYFARMKDMERELSSRRPRPWIEFLEEYTYPTIYAFKPEGPIGAPTISDCVANNLENEFKELGQDIFDEVFSIGDALAKAFHGRLCRSNPDEVSKDLWEQGLNPSATTGDIWNLQSMAQMQAFFTVDEKDPVFERMCRRALLGNGFGIVGTGGMDSLYRQGLGPLKLCGLYDLLFEAIECLFKGLTLEEALGRIILAALKGMGVEDFGKLFVGLPPEKRAELDALVKKNLKSGKTFEALGERSPRSEDAPFFGEINFKKPWDDEAFVEHQRAIGRPGPHGGTTPSKNKSISGYDPTQENRTLADKIAGPSQRQKGGLDPSTVFDAYILAMVEVYEDNYLALLDHLSGFPGAQLISAVISLLDCPSPPLFNPGIMDFLKSLSLPFCRNKQDIVSIRMENPARLWPKLSDIMELLFRLLKYLIILLVMKILLAIIAKVCEIIGNAICKALETVGAVAGSLPEILSGRESVLNVIRETICGPTASNEQVEATVVALVDQLGVGGAALADRDKAVSFFADAMNSMTRQEAIEAMLVGPSSTALDLIDNLIEFDYPEYREALPNKSAISSFYTNVGVLIPAETRNDLRELLDGLPEELEFPANPSMCATPEDIDLFNQQRCALLEGRMSPEQCEVLTMSAKSQLLEDLDDISNILNEGVGGIIDANMPPVFSDPGCNNGLMPYEPEPIQVTAVTAVNGDMKKIKLAYADDMLGDAGFFSSQKDWGFLNMVLSDTYGNPWTVHQDKVANGAEWVSYYGEFSDEKPFGPPSPPASPWKIPLWLVSFLAWVVAFPLLLIIHIIDKLFFGAKRGAYPHYVGGWLKEQFNPASVLAQDMYTNGSMEFNGTNDRRGRKSFSKSFDDLGFIGFLWDTDVELVDMPNYGYNATARVDFADDRVVITRRPRKNTPDITLQFKDNAKGYRKGANGGQSTWAYGYKVKGFYSDLVEEGGNYKNRPDDNIRVSISTMINMLAETSDDTSATLSESDKEKLAKKVANGDGDSGVVKTRRFEFLSVDNSLDDINVSNFENLARSFEGYTSTSPPIAALLDLTNNRLGTSEATSLYNRVNQQFYTTFAREISENEKGWLFGATVDPLSRRDFEYGAVLDADLVRFNDGAIGDFVPWWKLKDESGPVWASEGGFLGVSRNQYEMEKAGTPDMTRVFYLDPGRYGGSYNAPPVYAKPLPNSGWTGVVDLMFPERSPCDPKTQGLVGFGDIEEMVQVAYPRIPEDKRIYGDEDCVRETPFDRILTRPGKAAIRGLIMAGIRSFVSLGFMKSLATFTQYAPDFDNNYSKIYAGYILEVMKESMMSTGGNFLNPFNDTEFWYAYLEQSVQLYVDRLEDQQDDAITIEKMPESVRTALERIDKLQRRYKYPRDFDDFNSEDYGFFESMKSFRESKNLEAVQRIESDAKIVMQELIHEELNHLAKIYKNNLHQANAAPTISNMNYYFFNNFCDGGEGLQLHGEHISRPKAGSLPLSGSGHYSTGDQLALPNGTPYIGEYHVHRDIDGVNVYMAGREHNNEEEHDRLVPFAEKLEVVTKRSTAAGAEEILLGDINNAETGRDFYIKKYVIVNGNKLDNESAVSEIRAQSGNISDNYPGTMKLVKEKLVRDGEVIGEGKPIGVTGQLGVQYMIEFGLTANGGIPIASTTIDALDLKCGAFTGIEANSKLLLCLINQLQNEPRFRLTIDYVFSMKKALSMMAIYNDMGLLPSIGEWTTESGKLNSPSLGGDDTDSGKPGGSLKPSFVYETGNGQLPGSPLYGPANDDDKIVSVALNASWTEGWMSEDDRNGWFTSFGYLDWDEWDQQVLRKTTRRIKDIFKVHYRNRKFGLADAPGADPVESWISGIVEKFRFNPAAKILPWFQKSQARGNVFNANGEQCSRKNSR